MLIVEKTFVAVNESQNALAQELNKREGEIFTPEGCVLFDCKLRDMGDGESWLAFKVTVNVQGASDASQLLDYINGFMRHINTYLKDAG